MSYQNLKKAGSSKRAIDALKEAKDLNSKDKEENKEAKGEKDLAQLAKKVAKKRIEQEKEDSE
jgi:hypothetical protein